MIIGEVNVMSIESSSQLMQGTVNFSHNMSSMKMQAAAGSFNMGDEQEINNQFNINANTQFDPDVVDMPEFQGV